MLADLIICEPRTYYAGRLEELLILNLPFRVKMSKIRIIPIVGKHGSGKEFETTATTGVI